MLTGPASAPHGPQLGPETPNATTNSLAILSTRLPLYILEPAKLIPTHTQHYNTELQSVDRARLNRRLSPWTAHSRSTTARRSRPSFRCSSSTRPRSSRRSPPTRRRSTTASKLMAPTPSWRRRSTRRAPPPGLALAPTAATAPSFTVRLPSSPLCQHSTCALTNAAPLSLTHSTLL